MKSPIFTGSGVAIVTPFTKDTVDVHTLGRLLDFQLENGTDAVIVCGTTGEASTMTYRERMRAIEFCVDHVNGQVPVFCEVNPIPVKTALNLLGWEVGGLRLPLCDPTEANRERIRRTLVKYALLEEG